MAGVTIAAQVDEMRRNAPAEPDPRMAPFAREQAALAQARAPATVAEAGTVLPDAELLDVEGAPRTLSAALAGAPAVVVFYRGAWCPYCNITLRTYQSELWPALRERGIGLIAVSPQAPDGSLTMQEKHDLDFVVLSDPGQALANAVGIITAPTPDSLEAQLELGMDLRELNADGTTALPLPTVAIVAPDRSIRWLDVRVDYTARTEPEEILAALDQLDQNEKEGGSMAVTLGILARLEAKPGKGEALGQFLEAGRELALAEEGTVTWYAFRIDETNYGIFDTFEDQAGRQAHLDGEIPKALAGIAPDLLASDPDIRPVDVIAVK